MTKIGVLFILCMYAVLWGTFMGFTVYELFLPVGTVEVTLWAVFLLLTEAAMATTGIVVGYELYKLLRKK